jgi:uncharacterized membrane protein YbhN (UPF0104 family)
MRRWHALRKLAPLIVAVLFAAALYVLYREVQRHGPEAIWLALLELPRATILGALGLVAANWIVLVGYDFLALRYLRRRLALWRTALASFVSYVLSYTIGFSALGGTAARFRLYYSWGFTLGDIARLIVFCSATFWLSLSLLGGAVLLSGRMALPGEIEAPASIPILGLLLLSAAAGYLLFCALRRRPVRFWNWHLAPPSLKLAFGQLAVGSIDLTIAASILFVFLHGAGVSFTEYLGWYFLALTLGAISHIPGGLGVFETVILFGLRDRIDPAQILAGLLAFRIFYFLLPLSVALLLFGGYEARLQGRGILRSRGAPERPGETGG